MSDKLGGAALMEMAARTRRSDPAIQLGLLGLAAVGWWWSIHMADDMGPRAMGMSSMPMTSGGMGGMSVAAFMVAWVAMMAAMMFPAVAPVVRLYARASSRGTVAPLPAFVAGYLVVWSAIGFPAYLLWHYLRDGLSDGLPAAGRLAAGALVAAAIYQLTPLKAVCLRHCRSPMSFFLRQQRLNRPLRALRAGAEHGLFCLGCCWALMLVLVAFGTMQLWWMLGLAALIYVEKNVPRASRVTEVAAVGFLALGVLLFISPHNVIHFV